MDDKLTADAFQSLTGVSRETLERLRVYLRLLEKWQGTINLVSTGSLEDPWRRHMLDSAQLARYIPPCGAGGAPVIVDIGSGGGFPGLVLAIMGAGVVHLVESNRRKCAFLATVARETNTEVTIQPLRVESLTPFAADIVTARSLAPLDQLLAFAEPLVGGEGECLFLKGKKGDEELTEAAKKWNMRVERFASDSDSSGVVLRLRQISRDRSHGHQL
ncbi:MAG: 16S rRNA (guanine(527)-N(7))-methyltransferase RsmG [Proteobacteria bacterium]|nr:16S rRNA (guanine(527)-N(7))-methyltransferase RsmG [Pseudomonadota bacterium]